jgi:hypothetical protein
MILDCPIFDCDGATVHVWELAFCHNRGLPCGELGMSKPCTSPSPVYAGAPRSIEEAILWLDEMRDWIAGADHQPGCSGGFPPHPCDCGLLALRGTRWT